MDLDRRITLTSAIAYCTISVSTSVLFFSTATLAGTYTDVARFGGAAWVLLLSFIISMPLVTASVKRRMKA